MGHDEVVGGYGHGSEEERDEEEEGVQGSNQGGLGGIGGLVKQSTLICGNSKIYPSSKGNEL